MVGVDAVEQKILETIASECSHGFAGYAMSPEFLAQPVTKFCGVPMDVFTNPNSDSTGSRPIDLDAKVCCRLRTRCALEELLRIMDAVWMRKQIMQTSQIRRLFACLASDSASSSR